MPTSEAGERGAESAGGERGEEHEALLDGRAAFLAEEPGPDKQRDGGGEVGADRHEARVAEGELAGVAVHQVERDGEDDVDPDADEDIEVVGIDAVGEMRDAEGGEQGGEEVEVRASAWLRPFPR
jgi:hypothetical protein